MEKIFKTDLWEISRIPKRNIIFECIYGEWTRYDIFEFIAAYNELLEELLPGYPNVKWAKLININMWLASSIDDDLVGLHFQWAVKVGLEAICTTISANMQRQALQIKSVKDFANTSPEQLKINIVNDDEAGLEWLAERGF